MNANIISRCFSGEFQLFLHFAKLFISEACGYFYSYCVLIASRFIFLHC